MSVLCHAKHTTGHFEYAETLFRQCLAISLAGTAFQRTGFSLRRKCPVVCLQSHAAMGQ